MVCDWWSAILPWIELFDDLGVKAASKPKSDSSKKEWADKEGEVEPGEGKVSGDHPGCEGGRQQEAEQDQDVAGPSQGLGPRVHLGGNRTPPWVVRADDWGDQDIEGEEQDEREGHQHGCRCRGGEIEPTGFLGVRYEVGVEDGESDPCIDARQNDADCQYKEGTL